MVSHAINCKPRAAGTCVVVRFACSPASRGTIAANSRRRRGTGVASTRFVGWHSSSPSPRWRRLGTGVQRPRIRFCRQGSRRLHPGSVATSRKSGTANAKTFGMLDLWLREAHPVHLPVSNLVLVPLKLLFGILNAYRSPNSHRRLEPHKPNDAHKGRTNPMHLSPRRCFTCYGDIAFEG